MAWSGYSTTAGSNTTVGGASVAEGCAPSGINDAIRGLVADLVAAIGTIPVVAKNTLINGDMEIWQRGAGGSASIAVAASTTAYTADRWYITTAANEACTIAQSAGLTNGSRFCARVQRNSGQTGTGAIVFGQPLTVDQVRTLRGATVTISAQVRSGANWSPSSGNLTMSLYVGTGTEGKRGAGFTSETTVATVTSALGTSSSVTAISAVSGSTVPTGATQGELQFSFTPSGTAGTSDYVEIDEVQVEIAPGATAFERRRFGDELLHCQRFFWKTFKYFVAPAQNAGSASGEQYSIAGKAGAAAQLIHFQTPVVMRTTSPTATFYNAAAANAQVRDVTASADCSATSTYQISDRSVAVSATGNASTAVGNVLAVHATLDGDL